MKKNFMTLPDGREAGLYTIAGAGGMRARLSDFGALLYSLEVPDRDGKPTDVVLGYQDPQQYLVPDTYFGAIAGRVANRIKNGRFTLDGVVYQLPQNNNGHSLHGGFGFSHRLWEVARHTADELELKLFSPDGDSGYPGNLTCRVIYRVTPDNTLEIEMRASTDAVTVVNLTHHSYFNLAGEAAGSLADQELAIFARRRQEVDATLIPTGRLLPVENTPYDLNRFKPFPAIFEALPDGLDDSFVIGGDSSGKLRPVAAARSAKTGIRMDVLSTDIALQVYTGGALSGRDIGKSGHAYPRFAGFCCETQHLIDTPNHPEFPSIRLEAGEAYFQKACYRFSC